MKSRREACRWIKSPSRSPCGERGLKWAMLEENPICASRSPCGERGLKYYQK